MPRDRCGNFHISSMAFLQGAQKRRVRRSPFSIDGSDCSVPCSELLLVRSSGFHMPEQPDAVADEPRMRLYRDPQTSPRMNAEGWSANFNY